MKKILLQIQGMHCTSCAMDIDGELEDAGVLSANTNYAKQLTEATFDPAIIDEVKIIDIIKNLGYAVRPASE